MDRYSSEKKNYERAAIYRDRISALRDIQRSQSVAGLLEVKTPSLSNSLMVKQGLA